MVSAPAGLSVTAWGALQPLLSALPGPQCVAVMLRFCEALPQSVIAARMGCLPRAGRTAAGDRTGPTAGTAVDARGTTPRHEPVDGDPAYGPAR